MPRYGRARQQKTTVLGLVLAFAVSAIVGYAGMGSYIRISNDPFPLGQYIDKTTPLSIKWGSFVSSRGKQTIHTICTTNGSPYQNYQMRIAYASYRLILGMPGGERHTAFTRILHRTNRDKDPLAGEIPTFRADPLQPKCDDWCEYPVSDRANAVKQFWEYGEKAGILKEDWFYAVESDYVFMKPLELPSGRQAKSKAYGFSFFYISPTAHPKEMKVLYPGGDPKTVAPTGPAPILMTLDNWLKVTEEWERMAALIESKDDIKNKLGWVREMYGFSVAMAIKGIDIDIDGTSKNRFISELPHFDGLGNAHAYHYTLATIFKTKDDKDVWGYDKRFHVDASEVAVVPMIDLPPPFEKGKWKFIEGNIVTEKQYNAIYEMISQMNKAIKTLKPLDVSSN